MPTVSQPLNASNCRIEGVISYNMLESVPVLIKTCVSPFAQVMWDGVCKYCKQHCIAYRITFSVDGEVKGVLACNVHMIGYPESLN